MNSKLTLTIDKSIIEKAKSYAKSEGRSLSKIIENYLKAITVKEEKPLYKISPEIEAMKGSFKEPKNFDYKTELAKRREEKYLK